MFCFLTMYLKQTIQHSLFCYFTDLTERLRNVQVEPRITAQQAQAASEGFAAVQAQVIEQNRDYLENTPSFVNRLNFFREIGHRHYVWNSSLWTDFIVTPYQDHIQRLQQYWPQAATGRRIPSGLQPG
jgi:hypothetical protein